MISEINECFPEVVYALRASILMTGLARLFSANITVDDPAKMIARGKNVHSQFGPFAKNCVFLVALLELGAVLVWTCPSSWLGSLFGENLHLALGG